MRVFEIYYNQDDGALKQDDRKLLHFCVTDLSQLHKKQASPAVPPKNNFHTNHCQSFTYNKK